MRHKKMDFFNKKFGKLIAIKPDFKDKYGHWNWIFKCDCGTVKSIAIANVTKRKGRKVVSCGCWNKESKITHGMAHTRFYFIFYDMRYRCKKICNIKGNSFPKSDFLHSTLAIFILPKITFDSCFFQVY